MKWVNVILIVALLIQMTGCHTGRKVESLEKSEGQYGMKRIKVEELSRYPRGLFVKLTLKEESRPLWETNYLEGNVYNYLNIERKIILTTSQLERIVVKFSDVEYVEFAKDDEVLKPESGTAKAAKQVGKAIVIIAVIGLLGIFALINIGAQS